MIPYNTEDTIAAIASPPGSALRGIVRLSGPDTVAVLEQCFQTDTGLSIHALDTAQHVPGTFTARGPLSAIPTGLLLWPTARSYTRQPAAELHTVSSPALLQEIVTTLCECGARPAEPGEFTLRAFLAGRIDLTQAEAVLGVIDAGGVNDLNVALHQLAGGLATPLQRVRSELLSLLALAEARLDFAHEDEEIEAFSPHDLLAQLRSARVEVEHLLMQMTTRDRPNSSHRVVLRGEPNAGKSSLFNALIGTDGAIVSKEAGTTRDYVTQQVHWDGIPCLLVDTAGVGAEPARDTIEQSAVKLADEQADRADLEVICLDASRAAEATHGDTSELPGRADRIIVMTKIDLGTSASTTYGETIRTSSRTLAGVEQLRAAICHRLRQQTDTEAAVVPATASRCRHNLTMASQALLRAEQMAIEGCGDELVALEIREALNQVGLMVGAVFTEDILDQIFGRFCIGK